MPCNGIIEQNYVNTVVEFRGNRHWIVLSPIGSSIHHASPRTSFSEDHFAHGGSTDFSESRRSGSGIVRSHLFLVSR